MTSKIGFIVDPISTLNPKKDTSLALMEAATRKGYLVYAMEQKNLFLKEKQVFAHVTPIQVHEDKIATQTEIIINLSECQTIFMRKDPPVDRAYLYTTYLLELLTQQNVQVINHPTALRDANEKLFCAHFPTVCPETVVAANHQLLKNFITEYREVILKPLHGMGGHSIFRVTPTDPNLNVILETLTHDQQELIMAQRYLPEVSAGDKRILLIAGNPIPYALARLPAQGETRANMARGGSFIGQPLTARDEEICHLLRPTLIERGLFFVGIDVIGDYLTEINVTSPTGIRELNALYSLDIAMEVFNCLDE